jgi:DNA-binding transcriptional MerR regulator
MPNEQEYSIGELADLAGVTPRTIRYYVSIGLLASPPQAGPKTRYTDGHLKRLRLIRHLQKQHLPLGEIADQLADLNDEEVEAALDRDNRPPGDSALDYITQLRSGQLPDEMTTEDIDPKAFRPSSRALAEPRPPESKAQVDTRTRWERVPLAENVELHIRLPQGRHRHKQIDRLIQIGRELLEEGDR